jgi:precorrin-6B methylase 1
MMSNAADRLAAIQAIYQDANDNEGADLANAKTPAEVAAIQANLAQTRLAWVNAQAAALTGGSAEMERAFLAADAALTGVTAARRDGADIATLLGKLNDAASAATTLVDLAQAL